MKEQAILKINKIGKISNSITLICKILVLAAMVVVFTTTILFMVIPKEAISFSINEQVAVKIDAEKFGETLEGVSVEELKNELAEEEGLSLKGDKVAVKEVTVEDNNIFINTQENSVFIDLHKLAFAMFVILVSLGMIMVTLFFVSALCKAFRDCESPFEENVICKMQRFAYALIPWTIASSVINSVGSSILESRPEISVSVDMGMVLVVLVIFLLVYIFKYGAVLQQESDETL